MSKKKPTTRSLAEECIVDLFDLWELDIPATTLARSIVSNLLDRGLLDKCPRCSGEFRQIVPPPK